ncbi:hypothetical protein QR680_001610 [Steinernema hermaphroditum]|uniref:Exonuclease domain-containing protein n=1 Tax=Steinernema hermaphroditum TaxID=289476 RepID=A0AA39LGA7_9BILA|nr:hypothetical protein QR680_001610 [Steinernema hermaphroditum]
MVFGAFCPHGGSCNRKDCSFEHGNDDNRSSNVTDEVASYSAYFGSTENSNDHAQKADDTEYCPWQQPASSVTQSEGGYYASYAPNDTDDYAKTSYSGAYIGSLATNDNQAHAENYYAQESNTASYARSFESSGSIRPIEMYDPEECSSSYAGSGYAGNQYFPVMTTSNQAYTPEEYVPEDYKFTSNSAEKNNQGEGYNASKYAPSAVPEEYVPEDYVPDKQEESHASYSAPYETTQEEHADYEYDPVRPSLSGNTNTSYASTTNLMTYKPSKLPEKRSFGRVSSADEPVAKKRCTSPNPEFSVFNRSRLPVDLGNDEILNPVKRVENVQKTRTVLEYKKTRMKSEGLGSSGSVLSLKKTDIGGMSREQRTQMANHCIKTVAELTQKIERLEKRGQSTGDDDSDEQDVRNVNPKKESSTTKSVAEKQKRAVVNDRPQKPVREQASLDDLFGGSSSPKVSETPHDNRGSVKSIRPPAAAAKVDKNKKLTPAQLEAARKLMAKPQSSGNRAVNVKQGVANAKDQMTKRAQAHKITQEKLKSKAMAESSAHRSMASAKSVEKSAKGQRTAHHMAPKMNAAVPLQVPNCQIPGVIRQKYLNTFLEECRKIASSASDALEMAQNEEKSLCMRASTKSGYISAAVNVLKNLRSMTTRSNKIDEGNDGPGVSHSTVLSGRRGSEISVGVNRPVREMSKSQNISESELYEALVDNFLLTDQQFEENCYPLWDEKVATPKVRFPGPEPAKGKRFAADDDMARTCSRCGKVYELTSRGGYARADDCVYHYSRAFKTRKNGSHDSRYNCCGSDLTVKGCCVSECHVTETLRELEMYNFVESPAPTGVNDQRSRKVYALDCEMIYTVWGPALARVSVVDIRDDLVLDLIVKPKDLIVDCNTRFSGLTIEQLENVSATIEDAHERLFELINQETILIGHSLESDLKALRLVHPRVVDTSVVFPHRLGPPYKRALRTLTSEILQKIIQEDVSGHDSKEDASACMQLMLHKNKAIRSRQIGTEGQIVAKVFSNYDKDTRPPVRENADHSSIVVITSIYINSVKWETNTAEVDLYLREQWMDNRLKYDVDVREQIQEVKVPGNRKIWKPDTYFSNGKEISQEGKKSAVVEPSGYVRSSEGRTVVVPVEYQSKFPFLNSISFTLRLSSYNYALEDVAYLWANSPPNAVPLEVSNQLLNSEYSFQEAVAGDCVGNYSVGVYSCIDVVVSFESSCGRALLTVFLPTLLLVIASFLHFWIHGSWSVPRSFSAAFPFLIFASLFVFAPKSAFFVSSGIRVWAIFCLVITFFSLLEYFLVICCGIRRTMKYTNGITAQEQSALTAAQETVELAYNTKCANFRENNGLDIISRVLFPLVLIVFIIVYLVLYLI